MKLSIKLNLKLINILYIWFANKATALSDIMLLIIRLWIANVFFSAGLVKIDDFSNTLYLFENEYAVPFINPVFAAYSATFFELVCGTLLAFGLLSRAATLPLLAMTAVIQLTYDQNIQHFYWAMLLGVVLTHGAGKISADYLIEKIISKKVL
jgi:putative oxidoreductase